jgi:thiamine phosphate synthase YjbQ (UPF0047 family)
MVLTVKTRSRTEMVDISADVGRVVAQRGVREGLCMLYVPWKADYRHVEGNSPAHVKATLVGASQTVAIENGALVLGTWQGIFFCEFDGPRERKVHLRILEGRFK